MSVRVTAQYIQYAASGGLLGLRVAAQNVEVAGSVDLDPDIRVAAQNVEVAGTVDFLNPVRLTAQTVEVVRANDHRGLTGVIGTIGSGLASETLQLGAGSSGPSFLEPENTGQVGSRNSLAGGHLVPGRSLTPGVLNETGEIGLVDSILNNTHILAFGANILSVGVSLLDADNTIVATDSAVVEFSISVSALTDIDIDGNWTQTLTSTIASLSAENTLAMGVASGNNQVVVDAETPISMTTTGATQITEITAENTLSLTDASVSSQVDTVASNTIAASQTADVLTPILTVDAESTVAFTQDVQTNFFVLDASNTLVLTQSETVGGPKSDSTENTLSMSTTSDFTFGAFGRVAENTLTITQEATKNLHDLFASNPDLFGDAPESGLIGFTDDWVQEARIPDTFEADASNTIVLTQDLPQPTGKRSVDALNTLAILDFADTQIKTREVVIDILLTQTATFERIIKASNTLTMTTTADKGFVFLSAENTITLDHFTRSNPKERFADDTIVLADAATSNIKSLFAGNILVVTQDINVTGPVRVLAENKISGITDDIFIPPIGPIIPGVPFGLTHEATFAIDPVRSPSSQISLGDAAQVTHIKADAVDLTANSNIGFVQVANLSIAEVAETVIDSLSVATNFNKNTTDAITLLGTLATSTIFSIDRAAILGENFLQLKQSVGYSLIRDTTDCDYTPFVGVSDADTEPPRVALPEPLLPALDPSIRFRLVYPAFDVGETVDTLDMRAPSLGNRERLEATRILRETTGGTLTVFADPIWPEVHSLQLQFEGLKTTQARGMLDFMERWLGQEIGLYDHEGRIWKGVITNPNEAVIQDGREKYSATLEIEATRVYQLNRTALNNLGVEDVAGQDEALAFSTISATQDADFEIVPGQFGASALVVLDESDYTRIPGAPASSAISLGHFATRNSLLSESASSPILLSNSTDYFEVGDFGTLIHNWDSRDLTEGNGDPISAWVDNIGGISLENSGSARPTLSTNILNGEQVVAFRHDVATQRLLSVTELPVFDDTNKTGTVFVVLAVREVMAGGNNLILGTNPGSPDATAFYMGGSTATERPVAYKSPEGLVAVETPQAVLGNNTTQLMAWRRDNNDVLFRRNKVTQDGHTLSTNPTPLVETLYVGGLGSGNSADMDIAQILVYDDILSLADIKTIEGILTATWGV